jgi:integrase
MREEGDTAFVEGLARTVLANAGLAHLVLEDEGGVPTPTYARLCEALQDAQIAVVREQMKRDATPDRTIPIGRSRTTPPPLSLLQAQSHATLPTEPGSMSPHGRITVKDAIELFLHSRRDIRPDTAEKYRMVVGLFDKVVGGAPMGTLTDEHARLFRKICERLPSKMHSRWKTGDPYEAIRRAEAHEKKVRADAAKKKAIGRPDDVKDLDYRYERISDKTLRDTYMTMIRTFSRWAADERHTATDIFRSVTVKSAKLRGKKAEKSRHPFSPEDLNRIFALPLFTTCRSEWDVFKPGSLAVRDWRFWSVLIALYTGMRPGEIAQLCVGDFFERGGQPFVRVTTDPDPDDPDDERELKTDNAERVIPIHPELVRIGLLRLVDRRRAEKRKDSRLFPDWERPATGKFSDKSSKWFNRTLKKAAGFVSKRKAFYSLRHTFKDAVHNANISETDRRILMGHARGDVHDQYGSGDLSRRLPELFAALNYAYVDLSHVSDDPSIANAAQSVEASELMTPHVNVRLPIRKTQVSRDSGYKHPRSITTASGR